MRPPTVRALDPLGPAYTQVMAPLHAPSALSRAGPGSSAPDLTFAPADDESLTNKGPGIAARDRVRDVQPHDASVSVWRCAHKVRRMLDVLVEIRADRRGAKSGGEGGPLCSEPNAGFGWDVRHVDDLEIGRRRDGGRLNGEDSRDGNEAADVFEHAGGLGSGGDTRRRYKNTHLHIHSKLEYEVRGDVVLEVFIYIPEHSWSDIDGADCGSGWGSELHTAAQKAVVGVAFSALVVSFPLLRHRRGGGGLCNGLVATRCCDGLSRSTLWGGGSRKWSRGCGPRLLRMRWRYCGLMLGGKRTRGLLHRRGDESGGHR
jgi:hypothetical protein